MSGNPSGVRKDAAPTTTRVARNDDWQNYFTGMGMFGRDKRVGTHFNLQNLSFDQLKDLYLGDDLAARAVETIPASAIRPGYDIVISSSESKGSKVDPSELASEITQKLDVLGADEYLEVCGNYERAYGGSAMLLGVNDKQDDMTKPLDLRRVASFDYLTPLEARELMPLYAYNDPRAPKYGQPEIYQLNSRGMLPSFSGNFASTTMQVHESRLIIFPGIRVSRYQQTAARGGWGESVLSRVYRVLRDFNQAWSSAGVLVSDFAQSVIKIAGLWDALATDGEKAFQNRLAAMEAGRSTVNAVTIDAADSYERQQTPMAGLPDLLEKFAIRLAAACDMPLTLLFGTSPAGMNATGESDIRLFYDRVAAYQKRRLEPALRQLCQIIFRTMGTQAEPDKWSVKFRPLWQESAKDRATAMMTQAQADNLWVQMGVLSPDEVASSHWGKGEYDPNLSVDFDAREAQEAAAAAPVSAEDLNALDPNHYSYVPPPAPGTAQTSADVPAPGPASAPDPNTKPVAMVRSADSADAERVDSVVDDVVAQLGPDFTPDLMGWVRDATWSGPRRISLGDIDYSNSDSWEASNEPDRVAKFVKKIKGNWEKPIVLVRRPGMAKLMVVDGHHRALAYHQLGRAALAYVGDVPKKSGPWDEFHDEQDRSDEWSEEARAAAVEARKKAALGKDKREVAANARNFAKGAKAHALAEKAHQTSKPEDHKAAAKAHEEAAKAYGNKPGHEEMTAHHEQEAANHREAARGEKAEPKTHGEGGPKSEEKHPAGHEGKHGGEHEPSKGRGEGGKGKGKSGKEFGKGLAEGLKTVGETVAGEKASKVAAQLAPVGEGGESGED